MALFSWGKKNNSEPEPQRSPEPLPPDFEKEDIPADPLWDELMAMVADKPHFRLITFDGLYWIDPYNANLISAPFDLDKAIEAHFQAHDHWRNQRSLKALQLYAQRWTLWFNDDHGRDQRFQFFTSDGRWFNPLLLRPSESINRTMHHNSDYFYRRVAQELAQSPEKGLHECPSLEEIEVALGLRAPPPKDEEDETGMGSGIRLTQSGIGESSSSSRRQAVTDPIQPPTVAMNRGNNTQKPIEVPTGHVAYVVPAGTNPPNLPALLNTFAAPAQQQLTATLNELQQNFNLSPDSITERLLASQPQNNLPQSSDDLARALNDLRTALERDAAQRNGPSNQDLYNCIISLREDYNPDQTTDAQSAFAQNPVPVVPQTQLSAETIERLVSSLHSISLVANRITSSDPELKEGDGEITEEQDNPTDQSDPDDPFNGLLEQFNDEGVLTEKDPSTEPEPVDIIEMDEDWAEDMEKAGAVQDHLLGSIPQLKGVDLAIEYQPYSHIGGDFYQVVKLNDDRTFFILGDVSGHGVQAALIVSSIVNSLKIILRRADELSLADIISDLNDYMRECIPKGKFFTSFSGILDTSGESTTLECVCSGHHPTICLNPQQAEPIREIGKHSMGIGLVSSNIFRKHVKSEIYTLVPGDVLAIYTDGITETMDENGEELGEMPVRMSFFSHMDKEPHEQIQAVLQDIAEESDGVVNDDLTVMVIRIHDH